MNTVGKILVVLNLLFALVTGGFLVLDYASRTNHRADAEHKQALAKTAAANAQSHHDTNAKLVRQIAELQKALDQQLINGNAALNEAKGQLADKDKQYRDQKEVAEKANLNVEKWQKESGRLQTEVKLLNDIVVKRETAITELHVEIKKAKDAEQTARNDLVTTQARAASLLQQLMEKEKQLAKLIQGSAGMTASAKVTSPSYVNPPPAYVKGRIMKIDRASGSGLVTISLGSDVGVNKDNTLEVYRLQPRPEYLGRLLIREAWPREAVGRLMRPGVQLQEGDEVASTTTR